ncbi:MAG: class I SAM-dependent methyltransferase [Reichenbachiella sp.]|uniref:class I SAM-dependent methyltransferase n=1 Tax=Reichenbachiella sp. TaxID=2184521 RepID=UPI003263E6F0
MTIQQLNKFLGNIDLYLLDQILKNNIDKKSKILDAGCGEGRNLIYFLNNEFDVRGIDQNPDAIRMLQFIVGSSFPDCPKNRFEVGELSHLSYQNDQFDYLICSAVLHFARSQEHFWQMFKELDRVLAKEGVMFIRMTSDIGLTGHLKLDNQLFQLPDGSQRFLITQEIIQTILQDFGYAKIEPVKTVIVDNQRCMTTLVLKKN